MGLFGKSDPDEELVVERRHWDGLRGVVMFTAGLTVLLTLFGLWTVAAEGLEAARTALAPEIGLAFVNLLALGIYGRRRHARPLQDAST